MGRCRRDSIPLFVKEENHPKYRTTIRGWKNLISGIKVYFKEGKKSPFYAKTPMTAMTIEKDATVFVRSSLQENQRIDHSAAQRRKTHNTYTKFKMDLEAFAFTIKTIEVDNQVTPLSQLKVNGNTTLVIDKNFTELHIIGNKFWRKSYSASSFRLLAWFFWNPNGQPQFFHHDNSLFWNKECGR